jgi:hypothetical protein
LATLQSDGAWDASRESSGDALRRWVAAMPNLYLADVSTSRSGTGGPLLPWAWWVVARMWCRLVMEDMRCWY